MALLHALGLWLLLALPGALGSGAGAEDGASSNSITIVLLLLLLLLLVTGLALAWCRLSHDSGGHYHPARLSAALWGRTRRLFWASPPGRWLRARAEQGCPDDPEEPEDEDAADTSLEGAGARGDQQQCGTGPRLWQSPEPAEEDHDSDTEGGLGLSSPGLEGSGGSAEALLSNLHAFSGSAAWDDSAGEAGSQDLHATAL